MNVFVAYVGVLRLLCINADSYANDNNYSNVLIMSKLITDALRFCCGDEKKERMRRGWLSNDACLHCLLMISTPPHPA